MKAKQKERNKVRAHRESDFNRDGLWDRVVIQLKSVELHRTRRACRENSVRATTNNEIKTAILKRAAKLEKIDFVKTKEKNSDVRLPKNF